MADRPRPPYANGRHFLTAEFATPEKQRHLPAIETVFKTDSLVLLTGTAHPKLAQSVGRHLSQIIEEPIVVYEATSRFPNGEVRVNIEPNLRNRHVFFIQGSPGIQRVTQNETESKVSPSINDAVAEVEYSVDAAVRASAAEVTAILPQYPYGRQERKDRPRAPISAAAVAIKMEALGVDRLVTMDLHAEPAQGFASIPWDNIYASHVLVPEILEKLGSADFVVASPDLGGVKRAKAYKDRLHADGLAVIVKDRDVTNGNITSLGEDGQIIGNVTDKPVLIVDDIIGSGKTAKQALELLKANGATDVYLAVAHAEFTDDALENLKGFAHVFFTDSVNHEGITFPDNMTEVTIAPLLAEVIKRIHMGESVSTGLITPARRSQNGHQNGNGIASLNN